MNNEHARFRIHRDLGIEHVAATYRHHRFPPHWHEEYLIGLTIAGSEQFVQDGDRHVSRAGQVRAINPGSVHEGGSGAEGFWQYEALYIPEPLMLEAALSAGKSITAPRLAAAVIDNPALADALGKLFRTLGSERDSLAREEELVLFLGTLARLELLQSAPNEKGSELPAVKRARDYVAAHAGQSISLDALAAASGLSKFYLLRVFKGQTGLTPWQFQMQVRIDMARRMLAAGEPAGQVAVACGFVDQSHMTRRFRQFVGATPTAYAAHLTEVP